MWLIALSIYSIHYKSIFAHPPVDLCNPLLLPFVLFCAIFVCQFGLLFVLPLIDDFSYIYAPHSTVGYASSHLVAKFSAEKSATKGKWQNNCNCQQIYGVVAFQK